MNQDLLRKIAEDLVRWTENYTNPFTIKEYDQLFEDFLKVLNNKFQNPDYTNYN